MSAPAVAERAALRKASVRRMGVPFVLLTGGKGGVGKTNVSVNLSVALSEAGKRVMLMDALVNTHTTRTVNVGF